MALILNDKIKKEKDKKNPSWPSELAKLIIRVMILE
jgi:hypothetical protein